jgi:hypothetical protein
LSKEFSSSFKSEKKVNISSRVKGEVLNDSLSSNGFNVGIEPVLMTDD